MSEGDEWDAPEAEAEHDEVVHTAPADEQDEVQGRPDEQDQAPERADEPAPAKDTKAAPKMRYANLGEFVTYFFAETYARHIGTGNGSRTWCPWWWKHPEAIVRLDAIWRAWEHLRLQPDLGLSIWLLHHVDPHMAVLFSAQGPFKGCSEARGHNPSSQPLPNVEADPAIFAADLDV